LAPADHEIRFSCNYLPAEPNGQFFWVVSANTVFEKTKQIAIGSDWQGNWQVQSEPGARGSIRESSIAVRNSSARLGQMFNNSTQPKVENLPGLYLVLNFIEIPKAALNITAFGLRLNLANWINNFLETIQNGNYKILEFTRDEMELENYKKKQEIWFHTTESLIPERLVDSTA
jgi:hypothetical protein